MKWISVKDRLPEDTIEFVLVARDWGARSVMEANYMDGKFMIHRFGMLQEFKSPTHWVELPEPPEEE